MASASTIFFRLIVMLAYHRMRQQVLIESALHYSACCLYPPLFTACALFDKAKCLL